ncbi:unnamed protein product [Caenorhabditis nigoni]
MHTYDNPSVPTALSIFEPLQDGSTISVRGHVRHGHHNDFSIELLSGPNIVLHLNFRFRRSNIMAMNSKLDGMWGPEISHRNPLNHSDYFHLTIKVHTDAFHITLNGHHLVDYRHRYPCQSVQAVGLKGDVDVSKVDFEGFRFQRLWDGDIDHGHSGYSGYGTETYVAPLFIEPNFVPFSDLVRNYGPY